ncbi:hypothetical protein [Thiolapillus sp.]
MTHFIPKIAIAAVAVLALGACKDDYYYNGGGGYDGGYGGGYYPPVYDYDAPRAELVNNCKSKVREKVRNRIGHGAKISWGSTDIYNSSRREATINGRGTARNKGRKHKLHYTCIMNRRDAYVRSARVELDNDGYGAGGGNWNQKAIRACKERIRHQAKRNIRQQFSLDFTKQNITTPAERRRHVSGRALVKGRNGSGKIAYDCKMQVNPLRIDSAGYRWVKPLPAAGGNGGSNMEAKRICQASLKTRLRTFGYKKIKFPSTSVRNLSGNKKQVHIQVKARMDGGKITERWECRVNPNNGRILKMQKIWN